MPGPVAQYVKARKERFERLANNGYLTQSQSEEYVSLLTRQDLLDFIRHRTEAAARGHHDAMCFIAKNMGHAGRKYCWEDYLARVHRRMRGYHVI